MKTLAGFILVALTTNVWAADEKAQKVSGNQLKATIVEWLGLPVPAKGDWSKSLSVKMANGEKAELYASQYGEYVTVGAIGAEQQEMEYSFKVGTEKKLGVKLTRSVLEMESSDDDGDEANGSYVFTRTVKLEKKRGGKVLFTATWTKEYEDEDRDTEEDEVEVLLEKGTSWSDAK